LYIFKWPRGPKVQWRDSWLELVRCYSFLLLTDAGDTWRAVLMRYQQLIQNLSGGPVKLRLHKLEDVPPNSGDFRSSLKDALNSGECRFILDCDWYAVYDILHQVCGSPQG